MDFLSKDDLGQDIYAEILSGITRADDTKIATACTEAQEEVNGYLCARYDTADLFAKTEANRNKTVLSICRTIAIFRLHSSCNSMPALRLEEYDRAVKLLEKIQKGSFILGDAKLVGQTETEIPTTQISRSGNTKRNNYM